MRKVRAACDEGEMQRVTEEAGCDEGELQRVTTERCNVQRRRQRVTKCGQRVTRERCGRGHLSSGKRVTRGEHGSV